MTSPRWAYQIRIPDAHQPAFIALTNLDSDAFDNVLANLADLDGAAGIDGVFAVLADAHVDEARDIAVALVGFSQFRLANGVSAEDAAQAIAASLGNAIGPRDLVQLLASDGLVAVAKVGDLGNAYAERFFNGRVITDLRPVFDELAENVTGMIVFHQLALESWENGESREFFFTLDDGDLDTLARQIDRAKKKSTTLKALAGEKAIVLYGEEENHND